MTSRILATVDNSNEHLNFTLSEEDQLFINNTYLSTEWIKCQKAVSLAGLRTDQLSVSVPAANCSITTDQ